MEFKYRAVDNERRASFLSSSLPAMTSSSSLGVPLHGYFAANSLLAATGHPGDDSKRLECRLPISFWLDQAMHHEVLVYREMLQKRLLEEEIRTRLEIDRLMEFRGNRNDALFPIQGIPRFTDGSLLSSYLFHHPMMADKGVVPPLMMADKGAVPPQDVEVHQRRCVTAKGGVTSPTEDADGSWLSSYPFNCRMMKADKRTMPMQDVEISQQQGCTVKPDLVSPTVFSTGTKKRKADHIGVDPHIAQPPQKGWSCELCQVNVSSKEGLDEHFRGKKHKVKEADLEAKKTVDKVDDCLPLPNKHIEPLPSEVDRNKLENEWSCLLCQMRLNSKRCLDEHLKGRKHKAKEATLKVNNKMIEFGSGCCSLPQVCSYPGSLLKVDSKLLHLKVDENKNAPLLEKEWSCSACQITLNSEACLDEHLKGKKHRGRLKVKKTIEVDSDSSSLPKEGAKPSPVDKGEKTIVHGKEEPVQKNVNMDKDPEIEFWCELCKVKCIGEISFECHTNGKKHKGQLVTSEQHNDDDGVTSSHPDCTKMVIMNQAAQRKAELLRIRPV